MLSLFGGNGFFEIKAHSLNGQTIFLPEIPLRYKRCKTATSRHYVLRHSWKHVPKDFNKKIKDYLFQWFDGPDLVNLGREDKRTTAYYFRLLYYFSKAYYLENFRKKFLNLYH